MSNVQKVNDLEKEYQEEIRLATELHKIEYDDLYYNAEQEFKLYSESEEGNIKHYFDDTLDFLESVHKFLNEVAWRGHKIENYYLYSLFIFLEKNIKTLKEGGTINKFKISDIDMIRQFIINGEGTGKTLLNSKIELMNCIETNYEGIDKLLKNIKESNQRKLAEISEKYSTLIQEATPKEVETNGQPG